MAESNTSENIITDEYEFQETDVMVGDKDKRLQLYYQLISSMLNVCRQLTTVTSGEVIIMYLII